MSTWSLLVVGKKTPFHQSRTRGGNICNVRASYKVTLAFFLLDEFSILGRCTFCDALVLFPMAFTRVYWGHWMGMFEAMRMHAERNGHEKGISGYIRDSSCERLSFVPHAFWV